MSNVPPGGGFPPPPPSGPPPGGGFPPPPAGGGYGGPGGFQGATGAPVEWQDRLISGLIDFVGPFIAANILSFVVGVIISSNSSIYFNPTGFVFGLLALAWTLYNGYLAGQTGQSFGMKQSGLRLVGEQTGQPIGGNQGLVRNLPFVLYTLCGCFYILFLVDNLFPLWDAKKQTLRDKIAKSIVVKA